MFGSDSNGPRRVYDRIAGIYDLYSASMEWVGGERRRRRLFGQAQGEVLEVGVGTGLNLAFYPASVRVTGVDISPEMLARARRRAAASPAEVTLEVADVERLPFEDDQFDTAAAACVFCSVTDPVRGLRELRRVVRPHGRILLLEHVRPRNPVLGLAADLITPLSRRLFGPEVSRRTERNVEAAGLEIRSVRRGIWRELEARPA